MILLQQNSNSPLIAVKGNNYTIGSDYYIDSPDILEKGIYYIIVYAN
jgi:hypothetical protein